MRINGTHYRSIWPVGEDAFGIMIDMDDVIDMNSVGKAREILAKYGASA